MLGLHYGSEEARRLGVEIMQTLRDAAYGASVELAREKGPFARLEKDALLAAPFVRSLPDSLRVGIASHGIRNSHLLAIAPTGTISLLANNVSSGIEPLPAVTYERRVRDRGGALSSHTLEAMSVRLWRANRTGLPPALVTVDELKPQDHLAMQAAIQPYVDNAISKTINGADSDELCRVSGCLCPGVAPGAQGCDRVPSQPGDRRRHQRSRSRAPPAARWAANRNDRVTSVCRLLAA